MDQETAPSPLSATDRALLLAARAWGGITDSTFWEAFPTDRRASLRGAWSSDLLPSSALALQQLVAEHNAQARPDLALVHLSWWARALKDEPASVRAVLMLHHSEGIASALRGELGLDTEGATVRPPHPVALKAVLALWTERLVGDLPRRDDDPPVVAVLTRFEAPVVARFIRLIGLAKWSLAEAARPALELGEQGRLDRLDAHLADVDPRFRHVASADLASLKQGGTNPESRLGLTTIARLLSSADPYRARWALQHLPYPTAKALRTLMGPPGRRAPMVARWETDLLRASWLVLHNDQWVSEPWGWE